MPAYAEDWKRFKEPDPNVRFWRIVLKNTAVEAAEVR